MKRIVIAAAAAILAVAFAFGGYHTYQKREQRAQVTELVQAATGQLNEALPVDVLVPAAGQDKRLEIAIPQAEAGLKQLRALAATRDPALVEAADPYVASVLEVLRRQAGATRYRVKFTEDRKLLEEHMARVGSRSEGWFAEAIQLRKRLDQDHYDYQLSLTSLANLLRGLVEVRRKLAERLPAVPLADEVAITRARERALAAASATTKELEQAKRLVSPG